MFTNSTLQYKSMTRLPDACVFLNTQNNVFGQHRAVSETAKTLVSKADVPGRKWVISPELVQF